jgi:hypothetical protein
MTRPKSSGRCPCHASPADIRKYRSFDGRSQTKSKVFRPRKSRAKIEGPIPEQNRQRVEQWVRRQEDGGYYEWLSKQVYAAVARSGMYPIAADTKDKERKLRDRYERAAKELRQDVWTHIFRKAHLYKDQGYKHGPMAWLSQTVRWYCKDHFKGEKKRRHPAVKGVDGRLYTISILSSGKDNEEETIAFYRSPSVQTGDFDGVDPEVAEIYLTEVNRRLPSRQVSPEGHAADDDESFLEDA